MKLIDLSLSKHDSFDKETYNIKTVIDNHKTVVLLGSPGSGKTSVLKKYAEKNNQNVQYLSVKEFIKTDAKINKNTKFLFLDGLDEYRSVNNLDKAFAITELGIKIKKWEKEIGVFPHEPSFAEMIENWMINLINYGSSFYILAMIVQYNTP